MRGSLLLVVLAACWSAPSPRASPPAPAPPRSTGAPICVRLAGTDRLLLPAAKATAALTLEVHAPGGVVPARWHGKLVVDGTVTTADWPEHPPAAYPLRDGRTLLYDGYNANLVYLWDPERRALTEIGRFRLQAVAGVGTFVMELHDDGRVTYLDVDPDRTRPRLRQVWTGKQAGTQVLGIVDGVIAIYQRKSEHEVELACVHGPGVATTKRFRVAPALRPANSDAVRDHRVLMLGPNVPPASDQADPRSSLPGIEKPFAVSVWVLDLESGRARRIGTAPGTYTRDTAIPHPYVDVAWARPPRTDQLVVNLYRHVTYVDPATEHVRP